MALLIRHITVGEAATVINVIVAFFEYSIALAVVALLVYFTPPVHSALAWNVIGRNLHSSLWPTILRTDSTSARGTGVRVALFTYLLFAVTVLVAVAGVVTPLGLKNGPMLSNPPQNISTAFIEDTSPLGRATTPSDGFVYSRLCGSWGPMSCPGNANANTTEIAPEIIDRFNNTPYGPFGMQFRRWYESLKGYNYSVSIPTFSTTESLILRSGIFAVDGLIVDMDNPGIGLWNHTLPAETHNGGVWSEDMMWLEPVTACVDTNLTLDYTLHANDFLEFSHYNITDRGGFFNLTSHYPSLDRDGQNINVLQHAYKGAVLSNFFAMESFNNLTRNESFYGRTFPTNESLTGLSVGTLQLHDLLYLWSGSSDFDSDDRPDLKTSCQGYGGADSANISNVAVTCNLLITPPTRSDNGDQRRSDDNSTWTQRMYSCASVTRARMQRVEFSFNGTMDLSALSISRSNIDTPVLWASEKTDLNITDIDVFWGRVPDSFEGDDALWTTRSDVFYIPAGGSDVWGVVVSGQPTTLPAIAWNAVTTIGSGGGAVTDQSKVADYTGENNFALLSKFQNLITVDPTDGAAQILNLIWTDLMANNIRGSDSRSSLLVRQNTVSVAYDMRYAVPGIILFAMWVPLFGGALIVLCTGLLKFSYLRDLLTHTGAGRIAMGTSALKPMQPNPAQMGTVDSEADGKWALGAGRTLVAFQPTDNGFPPMMGRTEFSVLVNQESRGSDSFNSAHSYGKPEDHAASDVDIGYQIWKMD
ncbi:hypothetical protein GGX14DRAFT_544817 [Mycena pura]|uniref:Uncharacterized protein n=1 Tax=Mycena pura TaxID=153505 RepID=A0AAD6V9X6_9AGAR|nr:hypothetical protein GGX14DRAFT_544817 [Mycena pura]